MTEAIRTFTWRSLFAEWPLYSIALSLSLLGVLTMHTFGAVSLAPRQLVWILVGTACGPMVGVLRDFFGSRRDSIEVAAPLVQETLPPLTTDQVEPVTLMVVEA